MSLPLDQQRTQSGNSVFENVYIYGKLDYDFTKYPLNLGDLNVAGNSVFSGISTFTDDINIIGNLFVDNLTINNRLDVGVGGTILTTSTGNIGIGSEFPTQKLDVGGNIVVSQNIGIGSYTPQQKLDVAGSIKIDENIYDSSNSAGAIGAYLSRDESGIRWTDVSSATEGLGVLAYNEGVLIGISTFIGLNLKTGINTSGISSDTIQGFINPSNSSILDLFVYDYWGKTASNDIYRNTKVGINQANPTYYLDVTGDARITDALTVDGSVIFNDTLDVNGITRVNSSTQSTSKDTGALVVTNGGLGVEGNAYIGGNINALGTLFAGDTATFNSNIIVNGTAFINSNIDIDGIATLNNSLDVDGPTTLNNTLDVDGVTTLNNSLDVDGPTTLNNTVDVDGATTLNSSLDVDGPTTLNSTVDVDGATTLNNSLDVDGPTTLNNSLDVDGGTTLNSSLGVIGESTFFNNVTVNGTVDINAGLDVFGSTILQNTLSVTGDTTLNSGLTVVGASVFDNNITVSGIGEFDGELLVTGTSEFTNTTQSENSTSGSVVFSGGVGIAKNLNIGENLSVVGITTLTDSLNVDGATNLNNSLEVDGATTLNSSLQVVGTAGTVLTATESGNIGFGSTTPTQEVDFNSDVRFQKAIYDKDNNVGYRDEYYEVPRNVLTTVGVDTTGSVIGGRFYDAANLIRLNLDFIANEAVGFLTSTDYKNPAFVIPTGNPDDCKDDIKDILKSITYDITRGGNSRCVGAGLSYYNGETLQHITGTDVNGYSVKEATIVAITTAAQVARYVINNLTPPISYQGISSVSLIKDLSLQDDPDYQSNIDPDGCANVVSAIAVCAGIVTTIIGVGFPASGITTTYPDGKIVWGPPGADSKNIIYVSKYGNDDNNGRTEGSAKLTIGAAAEIAQPGDTIMVRSGVYGENNPIGLRTDVTVSGQDLRLVTIYPQNNDDVFYVRRGCLIENLSFAYSKDPYDDIAPLSITGAAVAFPPPAGIGSARSGFLDVGPANEGPSGRWRSPYIRNCTNFMTDSIGMKIDGSHVSAAFTGTNNLGQDLKCMVCDSFTQYNENGIGVSITNNGYAQLVSIFTINSNIAIYCDTGGSCDLTNSNSSFGNYGLYADGVGAVEFTGITTGAVIAEEDTFTFLEVKDDLDNVRKPFDGQAVFFKIDLADYTDVGGATGIVTEPLNLIREIQVTNGGSGYSQTSPPIVSITSPSGPEAIPAELSANISNEGVLTSIDVISSGRNFLPDQTIEITISGAVGAGASAQAITDPIYYTVSTATEPTSVGLTTVTFNEIVPYAVSTNVGVEFRRISRIIASGITFEYVGAGVNINSANPFQGGVPIPENEIVAINGGQVPFTSTDQKGNFKIGEGLTIDQATATISGRDFTRAIQANLTPLILALGG